MCDLKPSARSRCLALALTSVIALASCSRGSDSLTAPSTESIAPTWTETITQATSELNDEFGSIVPSEEIVFEPEEEEDTKMAWLENFLRDKGIQSDQIGFVYKNLYTGESFEYRADDVFVAASTIKVPMAMYTIDQALAGQVSLDKKLRYKSEQDFEGGSGSLQHSIEEGDTFSVDRLLRLAIQESDNIATNMIFRYWHERPEGVSLSTRMNLAFGMQYDGQASVTPRQMANVIERLYLNPESNPYYETLKAVMELSTFDDYATKLLPDGIYAHKYGTYAGYTNDIGIVYADQPYIFSIYAKNLPNPSEILSELGERMHTVSR